MLSECVRRLSVSVSCAHLNLLRLVRIGNGDHNLLMKRKASSIEFDSFEDIDVPGEDEIEVESDRFAFVDDDHWLEITETPVSLSLLHAFQQYDVICNDHNTLRLKWRHYGPQILCIMIITNDVISLKSVCNNEFTSCLCRAAMANSLGPDGPSQYCHCGPPKP